MKYNAIEWEKINHSGKYEVWSGRASALSSGTIFLHSKLGERIFTNVALIHLSPGPKG